MIFKKKPRHIKVGQKGEKLAVKEMQRMGLDILHRNFSVHNVGEIDIIARDGGCLVFAEVKTRSYKGITRAGEAVDIKKRQKIKKTANYYFKRIGTDKVRYRYDVVEVYLLGRWRYEVRYLANAYGEDSF